MQEALTLPSLKPIIQYLSPTNYQYAETMAVFTLALTLALLLFLHVDEFTYKKSKAKLRPSFGK